MFDTYFLADTVNIGERHGLGITELVKVLQAVNRVEMDDVTNPDDFRCGFHAVFASKDGRDVFMVETRR